MEKRMLLASGAVQGHGLCLTVISETSVKVVLISLV